MIPRSIYNLVVAMDLDIGYFRIIKLYNKITISKIETITKIYIQLSIVRMNDLWTLKLVN